MLIEARTFLKNVPPDGSITEWNAEHLSVPFENNLLHLYCGGQKIYLYDKGLCDV